MHFCDGLCCITFKEWESEREKALLATVPVRHSLPSSVSNDRFQRANTSGASGRRSRGRKELCWAGINRDLHTGTCILMLQDQTLRLHMVLIIKKTKTKRNSFHVILITSRTAIIQHQVSLFQGSTEQKQADKKKKENGIHSVHTHQHPQHCCFSDNWFNGLLSNECTQTSLCLHQH